MTTPNAQQMAAMQQQLASEAAKRGMTPEEFANKQRQQLAAEAAKQGLTPDQYINQLKSRALQQHKQHQQAQQRKTKGQSAQEEEQHEVSLDSDAAPDPEALAVAQFLRSQNLKTRTCILDGRRREMFKGKKGNSIKQIKRDLKS